jgi:hypothetical protein
MYSRAIAGPITGTICFFGLVLKNLGLDLKFPKKFYCCLEIFWKKVDMAQGLGSAAR